MRWDYRHARSPFGEETETHHANYTTKCKYFRVLPPHTPSNGPGTSPEGGSLAGHVVCLVNKELDTFSSGKDLFHVLNHDVLDLCKLGLSTREFICWRRIVVLLHKLCDHGSKGALQSVSGAIQGRGRRLRGTDELSLKLGEEGERHSSECLVPVSHKYI